MPTNPGVFSGTINVIPPTQLALAARAVGSFEVTSANANTVEAKSAHPGAEKNFRSDKFLADLEKLSWDLVWEKQVAVEFQPDMGKRTATDDQGRQLITMDFQETADMNAGNPKAGLKSFTNFDLLQRIRDHIVHTHVGGGDASKVTKLMANAAVLLAVEHFIKGVVNRNYALAEFYSVAETVENQIGGRHALTALMTKAKLDKITAFANQPQLDQRHAPANPAAVVPLPPNVIPEAAVVARDIIVEYAKKVV